MSSFTDLLSKLLKDSRLNQYEIAKKAGIANNSLTNYKKGTRVPGRKITRLIENALEITTGTLESTLSDARDAPDLGKKGDGGAKDGEDSESRRNAPTRSEAEWLKEHDERVRAETQRDEAVIQGDKLVGLFKRVTEALDRCEERETAQKKPAEPNPHSVAHKS